MYNCIVYVRNSGFGYNVSANDPQKSLHIHALAISRFCKCHISGYNFCLSPVEPNDFSQANIDHTEKFSFKFTQYGTSKFNTKPSK